LLGFGAIKKVRQRSAIERSGLDCVPALLTAYCIDFNPMKIPKFSRSNVQAPIEEIKQDGVPKRRRSTKFCLQVGAHHYPPKYVLGLAVRNATAKSVSPTEHSGGTETNSRLKALGFKIEECTCGAANRTAQSRILFFHLIRVEPNFGSSLSAITFGFQSCRNETTARCGEFR
jgi:hypothetical protein